MRKLVLMALGFLLLGVGAWQGWAWWSEGRFVETTDNATLQSDITVIAPKIAGYVEEMPVEDNQAVKAGDVLLRLDDSDYRASVDQAEATLAAKAAAAAQAEAAIVQQTAHISELEATLESAEAEVERMTKDLERYKTLLETKAASKQRYEEAVSADRKARAALSETQAAVAAGKAQLAVLEANSKQAAAEGKAAAAALELAKLNLEKTVVRAPVDGVIGNRRAERGAWLQAGAQAMVLVPLPDIYVVANFKETQIEHIRPGQTVTVTIDAYPDVALTGTIDSFAPASGSLFSLLPPENATGNFTKIVQRLPIKVRLEVMPEMAGLLVPGLSVVVAVDTRQDDGEHQAAGLSLFREAAAAER